MRRFQISETQIQREDSLFMTIESVTEQEDSAFEFEELSPWTRTNNFYTRLEMDFTMNLNMKSIER